MKITIEHECQKITLEDEKAINIWAVKNLIRQAVLGLGFHPNNVDEAFGEYDDRGYE